MQNEIKIGVTYVGEIENLIKSYPNIIEVLEIEPQTFWINNSGKLHQLDKVIQNICNLRYPKLIHSVGCPLGTSQLNQEQIPLLQEIVSILKPLWISEHLSFNKVWNSNHDYWTGFLLPPLQSNKGISKYTQQIKFFKNKFDIPVAIENGVNYFKPLENEIDDGNFIAELLIKSNCGLVLDIHNLWCNERNGRQSAKKFLEQIPLERVWELHIAGGKEENGYWIDAHSEEISKELFSLMYNIVPNLPNLKAIIFEIEPSYTKIMDLELIRSQMKELHKIRSLKINRKNMLYYPNMLRHEKSEYSISIHEWEQMISSLILGKSIFKDIENIRNDPGINIYHNLINSNRSAMILNTLKLSSRLIILTLGISDFKKLLQKFFNNYFPNLFSSDEGANFYLFLKEQNLTIEYLNDILELEFAILQSKISDTKVIKKFKYDILNIVKHLREYKIPLLVKNTEIVLAIFPDKLEIIS
jgi:uncharacterized protein (UPF0276 family)